MAHLTAVGTDAAGLGARAARYTLIAVWALGICSRLLAGVPSGSAPVLTVSSLLALLSTVLVTAPGSRTLPTLSAVAAAIPAYLSAGLVLLVLPPSGEVWEFNFPTYLLALLMVRGNMREGGCGGLLVLVTGAVAAISAGVGPAETAEFLALPTLALIVALIWARALAAAVKQERADLSAARVAELESAATEAAIAADRAFIAEVRSEAEPVLRLIRGGEVIDDALARDIAVAEGSIRDRLRSPLLRHPLIDTSVRRARQRRVDILLLGSDASNQSAPSDSLARAVAELIDAVDTGSVTVRALPPGRGAAMSVLVESGGVLQRSLLGAEGDLVGRH